MQQTNHVNLSNDHIPGTIDTKLMYRVELKESMLIYFYSRHNQDNEQANVKLFEQWHVTEE
jgi:hypothetical protein